MAKKPATITCYFCNAFSGAIAKRDGEGRIIKFCPRQHIPLNGNNQLCIQFQPNSYFFCTEREIRTPLLVCKERRKKKHCPKKCKQARIVDAISKMEDTHELISTVRTKGEFRRIVVGTDPNGNSFCEEGKTITSDSDVRKIRRIPIGFNRIPLSESDVTCDEEKIL